MADSQTMYFATPNDQDMVRFLGGGFALGFSGAIATWEQARALYRWARIDPDGDGQWSESPIVIRGLSTGVPADLGRAGDARNLARHVTLAGTRVMAAIAPLLEPDEDPVIFIARLLRDAGLDMPGGLSEMLAADEEEVCEDDHG